MKLESCDCALCERHTPWEYLEKHHTTPKSRKGKETVWVCCDCGNQVHKLFTNKELERQFNTVEKLKADPRIQKWIEWIKDKKRFGMCMKSKKEKR